MTNDQILEMAKQVEVFIAGNPKHIIAFARLIEKHTKKEDAEIAEDFGYRGKEAADAIRNSGGEK
jgi:hypothetical protein